MPTYHRTFAERLARVERSGSFAVAGAFDMHPPRLEVEGVGPLALPLPPEQAARLTAVAEPAPYGRGTETLVDPAVRKTWQLDATRVRLTGKHWASDLAGVVERVREGLGVAASVEAQLYKLLIYDAGSFFVAHRDTEKAPGMFATLVIVLPGDYSGGELRIRHRGQEARFDLHRDEPAEAAFAAFYADCVHEVSPIAAGYRLALIYNLVRVGAGDLPFPPDHDTDQAHLTRLLADWSRDPTAPDKMVYPLEHAYTQAEIAFAALKGQDAAAAQALIPAAAAADCDLHLALITVHESGWADYTGGGYWDSDELEVGEVTDTERLIHDWRLPDGGQPAMAPLPFTEAELAPSEALDDLDDAEPEFSEATGNEGASFERFYRRAAFILWPKTRRGAVLAAGGLAVSLPALLDLTARRETAAPEDRDALGREARALAAAIRAAWPRETWHQERASRDGHARNLLTAALRLEALELCGDFIRDLAPTGGFGEEDCAILAAVCARLPKARAVELIGALIAGTVARAPDTGLTLLAEVVTQAPRLVKPLRVPARALLGGLAELREPPPPSHGAPARAALNPDPLARGLLALNRIDPALAEALVVCLLANPTLHDPDRLLLPAALRLKTAAALPEPAALTRLRQAVLAHLEARIARSLAPPADWTRAAELPCRCADCTALGQFLAAPDEPVWRFKAAEARRRHVTNSAQRALCDLDLSTDTRGRPYALVCAKNQASYERRARQREEDLAHRARLTK